MPEEPQAPAQSQYLTELEQQLKAKDELIDKLRRDLLEHCCEPPEAEDTNEGRRKDRSVSQEGGRQQQLCDTHNRRLCRYRYRRTGL